MKILAWNLNWRAPQLNCFNYIFKILDEFRELLVLFDVIRAASSPRQVILAASSPRQVIRAASSPRQVIRTASSPRQVIRAASSPRQVIRAASSPQQVHTSLELPEPSKWLPTERTDGWPYQKLHCQFWAHYCCALSYEFGDRFVKIEFESHCVAVLIQVLLHCNI